MIDSPQDQEAAQSFRTLPKFILHELDAQTAPPQSCPGMPQRLHRTWKPIRIRSHLESRDSANSLEESSLPAAFLREINSFESYNQNLFQVRSSLCDPLLEIHTKILFPETVSQCVTVCSLLSCRNPALPCAWPFAITCWAPFSLRLEWPDKINYYLGVEIANVSAPFHDYLYN